jgi:hypothetical protein
MSDCDFNDDARDYAGWFSSSSYKPNELFVHSSKLSCDYICSSACIDYIKSVRFNLINLKYQFKNLKCLS